MEGSYLQISWLTFPASPSRAVIESGESLAAACAGAKFGAELSPGVIPATGERQPVPIAGGRRAASVTSR
jgi:hypothetical protein